MANRWRKSGNSDRFYFHWLQNHCGQWLPPRRDTYLLLGRKAMTNLDSILKGRDITLLTKVRIVKAMVFPVVMYICESWVIKKTEHWRTDVFKLWCWRRLLRVPWTARRSNLSILKEINPEYPLEGLMLMLNEAPILWPQDEKSWFIIKDPDAGKDWGQEDKEVTEDEMVGWYHQLNGRKFEQAPGVGDEQQTEWMNWTEGSSYCWVF